MSDATVVSLCNYEIGPEHKPQLMPSHFIVPAAKIGECAVLHVGYSPETDKVEPIKQYIPQLDHKVLIVNVDPVEVAKSIVEDYCSAKIQTTALDRPGLFVIEKIVEAEDVKTLYPQEFENAYESHKRWCKRLVKMADDLWSEKRSRRHIDGAMIFGAEFLGLDREWMRIKDQDEIKKCFACKVTVDSDAIICHNCKTVLDKSRMDEIVQIGA